MTILPILFYMYEYLTMHVDHGPVASPETRVLGGCEYGGWVFQKGTRALNH